MHMPDSRVLKQVFCGQLAAGRRPQCGSVMRYKDAVKVNMKQCGLTAPLITLLWSSRTVREVTSRGSGAQASSPQVRGQPSSNFSIWPCNSCSRICSSRIGLYTYQRAHRWQSIRRIDGTVQCVNMNNIQINSSRHDWNSLLNKTKWKKRTSWPDTIHKQQAAINLPSFSRLKRASISDWLGTFANNIITS